MGTRIALRSSAEAVAWFVILLFGLILGVGSIGPLHAACSGSPIVVTDKPDYGSTETVVISGIGFNCGETLSVLVTAPDGSTRSGNGTGAAGPDLVVTDDDGTFAFNYQLSGTLTDGMAYQGQTGIYRVQVRDSSSTVMAETTFSDAGGDFSCALTAAGGVKCWGLNDHGQLGIGTITPRLPEGGIITGGIATPVDVDGMSSGVIQVTVGYSHACALTTAGGVKCWGSNDQGQLGNGTFTTSPTPGDVSGLTSGVAQISAGWYHTCAVTIDGGATCWGPTPVAVSGLTSTVAQISAGRSHTCALTTAGGVKCWGYNDVGQLGNGTIALSPPYNVDTPADVTTLTGGVAQISSGMDHTCVVTTAGGAKCWGRHTSGQLGNGTIGTSGGTPRPVDVDLMSSGVAQISAGSTHTCAVLTGGGAKCWGNNLYGELGTGTFTTTYPYASPTPFSVQGLTSGVAQISGGQSHTCAVTTAGGVKCWGMNYWGQLGNGTFTTTPFSYGIATPGDVIGLTSGVAALWDTGPTAPVVPWTLSGFYRPVEMGGVWNSRKGGSTVPIKFQVFAGETELTDPSIVVQPLTAIQAPCSGGQADTINLTATGGTRLRYDAEGGHFIYNWKTPKMPGYCYSVTVTLTSGASLSANFELR